MKIAIDVSIQEEGRKTTGVERVQLALLETLARIDAENEYILVSKRGPQSFGFALPKNFEQVSVVGDDAPYLWRERFVPALLDKRKIDVFHSPVSATPILGKAKKIATVHELPWVEREPAMRPGEVSRTGHRVWLFLNVRYASRIVAVSERTRENILSLYPDAADRVEVIHHGVDARFKPLDEKPPRGAFLSRFDIPDKPFLFFVGTLRRKKNLRLLLEVFAALPEPERSSHVLVLAGIKNPAWPELEHLVRSRELEGRVFLPGYVTDEDLVAFYNLATATIYPSMFEGFGLPPLESMACGTPVVTSNGGAIPEVVGDAALMVPPDDRKKMEGAILSVLRDSKVRADLRKKGLKHAAKFTWDAAAERYLDLYRRLSS